MPIKGLKIETDSKGRPTKAIIDFKTYPEQLEDFIDGLIADSTHSEPETSWDEFKAQQLKKRGLTEKKRKLV